MTSSDLSVAITFSTVAIVSCEMSLVTVPAGRSTRIACRQRLEADQVRARIPGEGVISAVIEQRVVAGSPCVHVMTETTGELVVAIGSVQLIVASFAQDVVAVVLATQLVVPTLPVQEIVASSASSTSSPRLPRMLFAASSPDEHIVEDRAA